MGPAIRAARRGFGEFGGREGGIGPRRTDRTKVGTPGRRVNVSLLPPIGGASAGAAQKGFTMTMMTMTIISSVGTSFM